MKLGFIGFGNMGQAIAHGLVATNTASPEEIFACGKNQEKLIKNTKTYGFNQCKSAKELVDKVDMVIIAVKPYTVEEVIKEIKDELEGKILVSVVVNYTFEMYKKILGPKTNHISTLPNTPVSVGEGVIIYENDHSLSDDQYQSFIELFSKIALVEGVDTKALGIAGTISGCGPAFASIFIEALSDAAVKHGLARDLSYKLTSQMLVGTGKLQLESGDHPGLMKDRVCSPGGTTIKGVAALEENGFRNAVIKAIDRVLE